MARRRSQIQNRLEYASALFGMRALRTLPFSLAFRLGDSIGRAAYVLAGPQRQVAMTNLAIAFPEKTEDERRAILRESFRNLGRTGAEFCQMSRLTPETISERVTFADPADWEEKKKLIGQTGILVLGGHFGNWELQAYAFGLYGTPVHFIHRPFRNPFFTDLLLRERARAGTGLISKRGGALETIRVLRNRGIVVVPFDQNATGRWGVFTNFFGVPASTHPGLARLAMMSDAPVYPSFLVRKDGSPRHEVLVWDRLELAKTGDRDADLHMNLQLMSDAVERAIRTYPDHWIWLHKRWRTRPPGEPPIYA